MIKHLRTFLTILTGLEIWAVGLLALVSALFPSLLLVSLGTIIVLWLLRWFVQGQATRRTPADYAIAFLVFTALLTLLVTSYPLVTRPQVYRLLTGIGLYYALVNGIKTCANLRLVAMIPLLLGVLLVASAPFVVVWQWGIKLPFVPQALYSRSLLIASNTVNANVMAGALILMVPYFLAILVFTATQFRRRYQIVAWVVACAMVIVLLMTQSRGGLLALAAALATLITLRVRHGWVVVPAGIMAAVGAIAWFGVDIFVEVSDSGTDLIGLDDRIEVWSQALQMLRDFPLTGIGMGSFQSVFTTVYLPARADPSRVLNHSHNLLLQVALDLGLPGLIAWLAIFIVICVSGWQIYRISQRNNNRFFAGVGAGLLCSQIALIVNGLTDAPTWGLFRAAIGVWGLWGLTAAGTRVLIADDNRLLPRRPTAAAQARSNEQ